VIAAYLARAGEDVSLIARGARAQHLTANGVTITGLDDFTVAVNIVEDTSTLNSTNVLILAVKTYDTDAAITAVAHMDIGAVFSIQNGVMKNELLAKAFGAGHVLGSVCMVGGAIRADGAANYIMGNPTIIGELAGGSSARVDDIVTAFTNAKLAAHASDDIRSQEWTKFVGWVGISAVSVLTRQETWKFSADPGTARIVVRIVREAAQLARHLDINLMPDGPFFLDQLTNLDEDAAVALVQERGREQGKTAPTFRQSMLQDADKGKRIEVEETFGYALGLAKEHGLSLPTMETCYHVLAGVSRMAS
jgi:2-dehydropantoate 2-reductase